MTRILLLLIFVGFVSVATCFTTNHNIYKNQRKTDISSVRPFIVGNIPKHLVSSILISTTLLFEGKESPTTDSTATNTMLDGVVELGSTTTDSVVQETSSSNPGLLEQAVSPFFSQGEIDPETLNPDLSDPKQARVILYIILSLVPVLFLIPLMIGSRDLIPLDVVAPVQL